MQITLDQPVLPSESNLRYEQARNIAAQRQSTLQQMRMRDQLAQQQAQEQQRINQLRQAAISDPEALRELSAISPESAKGIIDFKNTITSEIGKSAAVVKTAPLPDRADVYKRQLQRLQSIGYNIDQLPSEYDPSIVDPMLEESIGLARDIEKTLDVGKPVKREIRESKQGIVAIDPTTGEAIPVTQGGQPLLPTERGQTINIGAAETEEAKGIGKIRAQRYESIMQSKDSAQRGLETLETLKRAVSNPEASQGAFADIRANAKVVGDLFGLKVEGLEDDAIIAAVGNKLALQLRNPKGEDGGLTGATSDRDLKFLVAGVPNRNRTQQQNLALIDIAMRDKARTTELANFVDDYLQRNKTLKGVEKAKTEWLKDNPLYEEGSEEKEMIKNMLQNKAERNLKDLSDEELLKELGL
jgi:hypothetical protein